MEEALESLRFPIGRYEPPERYEEEMQTEWITAIEALPKWMDAVMENLDEYQIQTPYREGGWTLNQVVHHLADSHINAFVRFKLSLTEDSPVIKPYDEKLWAELPDKNTPYNLSLTLLHALHNKWGYILRNISSQDWERNYYHPEQNRYVKIWELIDLYAWHGRHHMEQIRKLRNRMSW